VPHDNFGLLHDDVVGTCRGSEGGVLAEGSVEPAQPPTTTSLAIEGATAPAAVVVCTSGVASGPGDLSPTTDSSANAGTTAPAVVVMPAVRVPSPCTAPADESYGPRTSAASRALPVPRAPPDPDPPKVGILLEEDTQHNKESQSNKMHIWKKEEQLRNPSTYRGFQEPRNGRLEGGV
jgi:hypothetical protein